MADDYYAGLMQIGAAPADWQAQVAPPMGPPGPPLTLADLGDQYAPAPIDTWGARDQLAAAGLSPEPMRHGVSPRDVVRMPSVAPPMAQLRSQPAPEPTRRQAPGEGGGGMRGLLGKETARREAEAMSAHDRLAASADEFAQKSNDLVSVQQAGMEAQARAADTTAQALAATRESADKARMLDEGERLLEQDAIEARRQKIADGYDRLSEERVVDRRTPTQRAMSTLGVALSGLGDAMMAGAGRQGTSMQNTLRMIDQNIERDTDSQLRAIAAKREGLTAADQRLKDFTAQVGNDRAARQYAVAQQWEDYGHLAAQVEANTTSELKRNAATELGAFAKQQNAAARMAGDQALAEDTTQRVRDMRDLALNMQIKQAMGTGKPKDKPAAYGLRQLSEGTAGDATKAQEVSSGFSGVRTTIAQLKQMAAKGPTLSIDERATAKRRLASLKSQFNGVFGDGTAPNEAQLEELGDMFTNPTEMNMGSASKQFATFDSDATELANAKMRPYGYALDDLDVRPE